MAALPNQASSGLLKLLVALYSLLEARGTLLRGLAHSKRGVLVEAESSVAAHGGRITSCCEAFPFHDGGELVSRFSISGPHDAVRSRPFKHDTFVLVASGTLLSQRCPRQQVVGVELH
eukprot:scaffold3263_cov128-Skeletonema_menzelii.AAC.1